MLKLISKYVVDSTSSEARRIVEEFNVRNFALCAYRQTAGKCRYNREWITPYGNIALTVALPVYEKCTSFLPYYLVTQLTVASTLREFIHHNDLKIKWPNDIIVDKKR